MKIWAFETEETTLTYHPPTGTNQAVNFTAYTKFKQWLQDYQSLGSGAQLPGYQTTIIGLVSGAMGPLSNAPIDTIKTRLQKTPGLPGETAIGRIMAIARDMFKQEGFHAFYKGITPRVMRVAPGQAVTFTVYEFLKEKLEARTPIGELSGSKYEEWVQFLELWGLGVEFVNYMWRCDVDDIYMMLGKLRAWKLVIWWHLRRSLASFDRTIAITASWILNKAYAL
jgi:hypothetical protein